MVLPLKWNLFSSTFTWYYLFSMYLIGTQGCLTDFLSINYVGMSKDMGKRLPQLYVIKMKMSYDLGFIAIGVAMAT